MCKSSKTALVLLGIIIYLTTGSCKKDNVPVLQTTDVVDITTTTASSGGSIPEEESGTIIYRGVCWSTDSSPTTADEKTVDGSGAGSFTSNMINLSPGTTFYVKAYATNSKGTGYGETISFITKGEAPVAITEEPVNRSLGYVRLTGTVNPNYLRTKVSFEYGLTKQYGKTVSWDNPYCYYTGNSNIQIIFDVNVSACTTYHCRIKAENDLGTTYGQDKIIFTLGQAPTVITLDATNITTNGAVLNGKIYSNLSPIYSIFEYGPTVHYGSYQQTGYDPLYCKDTTKISRNISRLEPGKTYHFRLSAHNVCGTGLGNDFTFTTLK